jgi:uncharacterized protein (DUF58 family)
LTRTGAGYLAVWVGLLLTGLHQQINLILLTAGLAAGPLAASVVMAQQGLRKLRVQRRVPEFLFSGEPFAVDYALENIRRRGSAMAVEVRDEVVPEDRGIPGSSRLAPRVAFERVLPRTVGRVRWEGTPAVRGRYRARRLELVTRAPFGLMERRIVVDQDDSILVYPRIGRLTRRWHQLQRESNLTRRGLRHDRTAQQQEYHGLRDYRSGDSPRWIHWRTSARTGQLMVKEFEQENDQGLMILVDPWMPRTKATSEQRELVEQVIRFAATVCLETSRQPGRRLLLGWTGDAPGIRQGPASVRLLHEMLEVLSLMRPNPEGSFAALLDALPPASLRESRLVIASTRPLNLDEEAARSPRFAEVSARNLGSRLLLLNAARGDLAAYVDLDASARVQAQLGEGLTPSGSMVPVPAISPGGPR